MQDEWGAGFSFNSLFLHPCAYISANNYCIRFSALMITILIIANEYWCALNYLNKTVSNYLLWD